MIRILLAEDEATVREAVQLLLNMEADFDVVGLAENGKQAVDQFNLLHPDIVIMDVRMPVMNGVEATKIIRRDCPDSKILIWTTFKDDEKVGDAIRSGAMGYLLKNDPSEALSASIRAAYRGCNIFSPGIINDHIVTINPGSDSDAMKLPEGFKELTPREKDILRCLGSGDSYTEIAQELYLTPPTVRNYVHNLFSKLGIQGQNRRVLFAKNLMDKGLL